MLPRTKSIFYIGDDYGEAIREEQNETINLIPINPDTEKKPVGLRVIIEKSPMGSSVVTKCMMNFKVKELGFLKTCFFCHKELSSQMDVFVYKGEQTFCSAECRRQKILTKRRIEIETYTMRLRGGLNHNYRRDSYIPRFNGQKIITTLVT